MVLTVGRRDQRRAEGDDRPVLPQRRGLVHEEPGPVRVERWVALGRHDVRDHVDVGDRMLDGHDVDLGGDAGVVLDPGVQLLEVRARPEGVVPVGLEGSAVALAEVESPVRELGELLCVWRPEPRLGFERENRVQEGAEVGHRISGYSFSRVHSTWHETSDWSFERFTRTPTRPRTVPKTPVLSTLLLDGGRSEWRLTRQNGNDVFCRQQAHRLARFDGGARCVRR